MRSASHSAVRRPAGASFSWAVRGVVAVAFVLFLGVACPAVEAAVSPTEAAKALFLEGRDAFASGHYEKALESFEAANRIVPSFVLQFNIGRCFEEALRYDEALAAFALVVRHADDPALEAKARAQVESIKARAARSGIRVLNHQLGIRVLVDGVACRLDPTGFLSMSPGTRRVEIWQPFHRPHLHYVVIAPEEIKDISLVLLPKERLTGGDGQGVDTQGGQSAGFSKRYWPALASLGVGLVGLGVGVTLRVMGQAEWDDIAGAKRDDDGRIVGMSERTAQSRADYADRLEIGSFVSFGIAGFSIVSSALLLALAHSSEAAPRRSSSVTSTDTGFSVATPQLGVAPGGLNLRWSW
jgi:hypothetical protein